MKPHSRLLFTLAIFTLFFYLPSHNTSRSDWRGIYWSWCSPRWGPCIINSHRDRIWI